MIIGAMRVKNEQRWIADAVRSILPVCSEVFVLDDHSTDRTAILAQREGAFVFGSPFSTLDEARDKSHLMEVIRSKHGQGSYWVLMIDGDELLARSDLEMLRAAAISCRPDGPPSLTLRILYLWDRPDQIRTDGVYANMTRPSLFDSSRTNMIFRATAAGGSFH